jgi:hypothetical protein
MQIKINSSPESLPGLSWLGPLAINSGPESLPGLP